MEVDGGNPRQDTTTNEEEEEDEGRDRCSNSTAIVLQDKQNLTTMKFTSSLSLLLLASAASAFAPKAFGVSRSGTTSLSAQIRPKTQKSEELAFGWDGTTALGGAVEVAKPTRMLDEIRAAGETIPPECEVFNANVEMSADDLKFEDVMEIIDTHYEVGLIEFKNGDIVNKQGENEGSAKLLSYAALSEMDKETTLKVRTSILFVFET